MSIDITPLLPKGSQIIKSYGGGFKVADCNYRGSIIVFPERTVKWQAATAHEITIDSLDEAVNGGCGILLVGCGRDFLAPPPLLRQELKRKGVVLEWMNTGAACRTFNILLAEGRQAAAALIAVE